MKSMTFFFLIIMCSFKLGGQPLSNPFLSGPEFSGLQIEQTYHQLAQQLSSQFWSQMESKLRLLSDNYLPYKTDHKVFYYTQSIESCVHQKKGEITLVADVQSNVKKRGQDLQYVLQYSSCNSQLKSYNPVFKEIISVTTKEGEEFIPLKDIRLGQRKFVADASHIRMEHQYLNSHHANSLLMRVTSRDDLELATTEFYFLHHKLLEIELNKAKKVIVIMVYHNDLHKDFSKAFLSLKEVAEKKKLKALAKKEYEVHRLTVRDTGSPLAYQYDHYDSKVRTQLSPLDFNNKLNEVGSSWLQETMGLAIIYFEAQFPETQVKINNLVNNKFIKELQLMETRLKTVNPSNVALARTQILSFLRDIEKGELVIIDNRKEN